jgi:hypothetical protein
VRIEGLPRKAITYVDDATVDAGRPFPLPVGTHRLRVETPTQELVLSRTITVGPSGLTVSIPSGGPR